MLLPILLSCSASRNTTSSYSAGPAGAAPDGGRRSWSVSVFRDGSPMITGIMVADLRDIYSGGEIAATMVNEFGVRAFDFEASRSLSGKVKVKLLSPMKALSNPFIRCMLRKDLKGILSLGGLLETSEGDYPYRYSSSSGMEYVFSLSGR